MEIKLEKESALGLYLVIVADTHDEKTMFTAFFFFVVYGFL